MTSEIPLSIPEIREYAEFERKRRQYYSELVNDLSTAITDEITPFRAPFHYKVTESLAGHYLQRNGFAVTRRGGSNDPDIILEVDFNVEIKGFSTPSLHNEIKTSNLEADNVLLVDWNPYLEGGDNVGVYQRDIDELDEGHIKLHEVVDDDDDGEGGFPLGSVTYNSSRWSLDEEL
ncbi:hypothetical protein GS429_15910 [Natronorubrum sp. JWXQ-INN-674]|uniref:Uncharacterized protein n=1 Tax=Natronorubrum halalkaliphilum TaxID=2691917 RepID=A0A6B0VPW4_9EURY|nr:hypothetical protein [Natronorubrum halalkaliphilum]MXV63514.1 hypothetical protein [Natronorubrum halalkaliphilum]